MDNRKTKKTQNARKGRPTIWTKAGYTTLDKFESCVPFCGLVTRSDNLSNQQLEQIFNVNVVYNSGFPTFFS